MSRMGVSIRYSMGLRGQTRVREDARQTAQQLKKAEAQGKKVIAQERGFLTILRSGLDIVSTVQLTRFAIRDVMDLASGKGGLGDILSLLTSSILLIYRLNFLIGSSTALSSLMTLLSGPPGWIVAGIVAAIGAAGAIWWGVGQLDQYTKKLERLNALSRETLGLQRELSGELGQTTFGLGKRERELAEVQRFTARSELESIIRGEKTREYYFRNLPGE